MPSVTTTIFPLFPCKDLMRSLQRFQHRMVFFWVKLSWSGIRTTSASKLCTCVRLIIGSVHNPNTKFALKYNDDLSWRRVRQRAGLRDFWTQSFVCQTKPFTVSIVQCNYVVSAWFSGRFLHRHKTTTVNVSQTWRVRFIVVLFCSYFHLMAPRCLIQCGNDCLERRLKSWCVRTKALHFRAHTLNRFEKASHVQIFDVVFGDLSQFAVSWYSVVTAGITPLLSIFLHFGWGSSAATRPGA